MDKYEFNIKVEQIKKLVNKGDFETAMKIADTIDWRRVRSTSLLTMISQIYEKNAEYQDAKDILLLAYERAPLGKGLLYKLTDLALRENNIQEAEAYYREFCELSGDDPRQCRLSAAIRTHDSKILIFQYNIIKIVNQLSLPVALADMVELNRLLAHSRFHRINLCQTIRLRSFSVFQKL